MIAMVSRLFGQRSSAPPSIPIDMTHLNDSFQLLRNTASQVAEEATKASKSIEEQSKRIKACFTALNSASDIITIIDSDHCIYFCNDQFAEVFGDGNFESIVGLKFTEVVEGIENPKEMWITVGSNHTWEADYKNKYKMTIVPMMNGAPSPIYYICTLKLKKKNGTDQ